MEGGRGLETPLGYHASAVSLTSVAGRAEDVEPLLTPLEERTIDGHGKRGEKRAFGILAFVESTIFAQLSSGDSALDRGSRRHAVGEEGACLQWLIARLIVHILSAGCGRDEEHTGHGQSPETSYPFSGPIHDTSSAASEDRSSDQLR
jgi:hypothetical protein